MAQLNATFHMRELKKAIADTPVGETIAVQALSSMDETLELLRICESSDLVSGVIGWVDLTADDVSEQLLRISDGPGNLVGIRHQIEDEDDPLWLLQPRVLSGLKEVAKLDLAFDLLVRVRELPASIQLAHRLPELTLVVDHCAKPPIAHRGWQPWRDDLAELATFENVACKLSGLLNESRWKSWEEEPFDKYCSEVLDIFGSSRVMFGSDWPVCTLVGSYQDVYELAQRQIAMLSSDEKSLVMRGNAQRIYGLSGFD
jgi:L-fuconolactonase